MNESRTLTVAPAGDREIVITRAFAAPRHLVFDAWTKPELLRRWFGPRTWVLAVCEIDLRAGGVYREVAAPERLVTTESFDDDWTGGETLVTSEFVEQGGATTLTITVLYSTTEARDSALASGMEHGMADSYGRLDELLATQASAA